MPLKRLLFILSLSLPLVAVALVIAPSQAVVSFAVGDLPVIISPSAAGGTLGTGFNYQITAINSPTGYSASGLPAWLNFNATTGRLSGTPTSFGVFNVNLTTTNAAGTYSATLTLNIANYVDANGNGVNDAWEMTYFGNLTTVTATSVNNVDGLLDRDEAALGLDPTQNNLTAPANNTSYTYNLRNELTNCTPAAGAALTFSPDSEGNLN